MSKRSVFFLNVFICGICPGVLPTLGQGAGEENIPVYAVEQPAPFTPYLFRLAIEGGDQAGGPVRYNTRFPAESSDPNPTSYYHTQAFVGANLEFAFTYGALQLGVLRRRDLAHRGIVGRLTQDQNGQSWTVKQVAFQSDAVTCGWVFGRMYREASWRASLATIVDFAKVTAQIQDEATARTTYQTESRMLAMTLRGRGVWRAAGTGMFDIHLGPEIHVPVYSRKTTTTDSEIEPWLNDSLDLKSAAAIGLVAEIGVRF